MLKKKKLYNYSHRTLNKQWKRFGKTRKIFLGDVLSYYPQQLLLSHIEEITGILDILILCEMAYSNLFQDPMKWVLIELDFAQL